MNPLLPLRPAVRCFIRRGFTTTSRSIITSSARAMVSGMVAISLTAKVRATYPTEEMRMESLINSAGIFSEKCPDVSVTVPRLRLMTPTPAYTMGSRVDCEMTVRACPHMEPARKSRHRSLDRKGFMLQMYIKVGSLVDICKEKSQMRVRRVSPRCRGGAAGRARGAG